MFYKKALRTNPNCPGMYICILCVCFICEVFCLCSRSNACYINAHIIVVSVAKLEIATSCP